MAATHTRKTGSAPITRHPLFPAIVSLWLAAACGLGSLALRTAQLESAVLALRLDTVVYAAAPPLGFTARILVALALSVFGAVLGFVLGRVVARPAKARGESVVTPAPAAQAHDDGEDLARLEAARPAGGRRRPLAMQEDYGPAPVQLSAHDGVLDPEILDLSSLEDVGFDRTPAAPEPQAGAEPEPAVEAPRPVAVEPRVESAPQPECVPEAPAPVPVAPVATAPSPEPVTFARPTPARAATAPTGEAAARLLAAPLDSLGLVEMAERLALALARHRQALADALAADEPRAAVAAPAPVMAEVAKAPEMPAPQPVAVVPPAPVLAEPTVVPVEAEPQPAVVRVAPEPVAEPPLVMPSRLPAALRPLPVAVDEDDDDDSIPEAAMASLLPPRAPLARPEPVPAPVAAAPRRAFDAGPAPRIEEPAPAEGAIEPVVIFPGQAQPAAPGGARRFDAPVGSKPAPAPAARPPASLDGTDTEAALKAALATLQRMSGAA